MEDFVLILGCMFSGKTTELIHTVERYLAIDSKVLVVNHSFDKERSGGTGIMKTHSGKQFQCYYSDSIPMEKVEPYDIVAINEAQFFDGDELLENVLQLRSMGKRVIVCGLDADFRQEPFANILALIPHATKVVKTTAFCIRCKDGTPALYSYRTAASESRVLIGNENAYQPVCGKCYQALEMS